MRKLSVLHLLLFAALLAFPACQKEQLDEKSFKMQSKNASLDNIRCQKGILIFKDMSDFENTVKTLAGSSESEKRMFGNRKKFTSLKVAYENGELKYPEEMVDEMGQGANSADKNDGKAYMDWYNNDMSNVLSAEGYVIIGFTFHQFTQTAVKSVNLSKDTRIADAIKLVNAQNLSSQVKVNLVKLTKPDSLVNTNKNARVNRGYYEIVSPWEKATTNDNWSYCVWGQVELASVNWDSLVCEYYYYDDNCMCDSCGGEVEHRYGTTLRLKVRAESRLWNGTYRGREQPDQARHTKAVGNLTLSYDGRIFQHPVNTIVYNQSYFFVHLVDTIYSDVQNVNSVWVEGYVTFEARHFWRDFITRTTMYL